MRFLGKLFDPNEREVKQHFRTVAAIGDLEAELQVLDDEALRARADELRSRARGGEDIDELLVDSFALTREAARRTIGMRHFDVQLIGGIVLHLGKIAEMKTGEGKTLVATLPLVLNALGGSGAHLVTVNDYLARRDAGWMAPLYDLLGLSVGVVIPGASGVLMGHVYDPDYLDESHPDPRLQHLRPSDRKEAYACDITYGTNNEFGFDYLRDNMAVDLAHRVQRDPRYAIVDEVDSILIDEARTPLIISGQGDDSTDKYYEYARHASKLQEGADYTIEEKYKSASLTEEGINKMQRMTGIKNVYDLEHVVEAHQINQALKAKALYQRDRDYLVLNSEAIIVDEFTGRTMQGRRWSDGLHQAVEAKEGLKVQQEMKTLATITLQNYFRLYGKLAGMTGTALTEAEEFHKIYGLEVVEIPTNKPMCRTDHPDLIYKSEASKFEAVIEEILEMNRLDRPVLVGTVSVEKSERLARLLGKRGIPHNVLNAKQHEREAAIIAEAGQPAGVTIATNMAGRGTDIVLGSSVAGAGGLHIIGTERHESRRIDNQLRGRAGRQGDPGSSRFFISLEDDLMRIFGPAADRIGRLMERLDVEPIEHKWVANSIEGAQKKVEGMNFDTRKHVVEYDNVMNTQRAIIYGERDKVLAGANTRDNILEYIRDVIAKGVEGHCQGRHPENWDLEGLLTYLGHYFPIAPDTALPDTALRQGQAGLTDYLSQAAYEAYEAKESQIGDEVLCRSVERFVLLRTIDQKWIDYLTTMEHFREGIGLQAYGQRDPLVEYKIEAHKMFEELTEGIRADIVANMFRVQVTPQEAPPEPQPAYNGSVSRGDGKAAASGPGEPVGVGAPNRKLGRNDLCWCGSGRKYKRCHGR
ncbi:MAG: preprotein translocase subunit SecA [Candidatus Dormibacteraeota bacterium]|jgi:preprotein translocase subunit SecA|nr:preprotein translocase subunit SecA [Candidatus Dormibacteraeota bacterium]